MKNPGPFKGRHLELCSFPQQSGGNYEGRNRANSLELCDDLPTNYEQLNGIPFTQAPLGAVHLQEY